MCNSRSGDCEKVVNHDCAHHKRFVHFCADGAVVACETEDHDVGLWDTLSCTAVGQQLQGLKDEVTCVALSLDGSRIVSGSRDCTVRVWEAESGTAVRHPLQGHTKEVTCVALSGDGRRIVSGSLDNTVRVWDAESGTAVGQPLRGHGFGVCYVAVNANGTRVMSADSKMQRLWALSSGGWECVLTSWDASWQRTIGALDLTSSPPRWGGPSQREVRAVATDGSEIVLGTCERLVRNIRGGDAYLTEDFRSCRIVRGNVNETVEFAVRPPSPMRFHGSDALFLSAVQCATISTELLVEGKRHGQSCTMTLYGSKWI